MTVIWFTFLLILIILYVYLLQGTFEQSGGEFTAEDFKSKSKAVAKPHLGQDQALNHIASPRTEAPFENEEQTVASLDNVCDLVIDQTNQRYRSPKAMTEAEQRRFMFSANLAKMTVLDYQNWLQLFDTKGETNRLTRFHRNNLRVLQRGGTLTATDLPRQTVTPNTAKEQFSHLVDREVENVPHPEFHGMQPANFDKHIPFKAAVPNRNMHHLNFVNPDEPLKTWELSRGQSVRIH